MTNLTNSESEDWWDDSKSFDGVNKALELEKENQKNLKNQLSQFIGKSIYIKFPSVYFEKHKENEYEIKTFYSNTINFTIDRIYNNKEFVGKGNMMCSGKEEGWFSSEYLTPIIEMKLNIQFWGDRIDMDMSAPGLRLISCFVVDINIQDSLEKAIYYAEYITKDSAMLLFSAAKIIHSHFKPSMDCIKRRDYRGTSLPIK